MAMNLCFPNVGAASFLLFKVHLPHLHALKTGRPSVLKYGGLKLSFHFTNNEGFPILSDDRVNGSNSTKVFRVKSWKIV